MKFTKVFFSSILAVSCLMVSAQFVPDYKRTADKYYAQGDYYSAAVYYEKYLSGKKLDAKESYNPYSVKKENKTQKGSNANTPTSAPTKPPKGVNTSELIKRIAEGYKSVNDYKKAEEWYNKLNNTDKANNPLAEYWLGVCQRANGKFDEAEATFKSFTSNYTSNDEYNAAGKNELENLVFLREQKTGKAKELFTINKANLGVNQKECGHYAPFVQNGVLYFTSTSKDSTEAKNSKLPYINHLYATKDNEIVRVNLPGFDGTDQGVASFTPNGNNLFFTRRVKENGKNVEAIYKSSRNLNGVWSEPEKLGAEVNAVGAITKQPSVTPDGKYLLFSSDRSGGKGKFDIWYASLDANANASNVTNLDDVNTKEDDEAPYYHQPSMQLVIASKGYIGMGGFDLYTSKGKIGGDFTKPTNIGYPINTEKDDIYFYSNDDKFLLKNFYMSSDRESVCLEMYTASKVIKKFVGGKVVDSKTGEPLSGVSISMVNENGKPVGSSTTNEDGKFMYETDPYSKVVGKATKEEYVPSTKEVENIDFNQDVQVIEDWRLTAIEKPPPPPAESKPLIVRFEFDKFDILEEYKESLDNLAAMMQREPGLNVEIGGYTDEKGSVKYNLKLSEKRANAGKEYLITKYGIDASRITTKGYGKCCPIEKETNEDGSDNEEARKANRRLEFKIQKS